MPANVATENLQNNRMRGNEAGWTPMPFVISAAADFPAYRVFGLMADADTTATIYNNLGEAVPLPLIAGVPNMCEIVRVTALSVAANLVAYG